MKKIAVVTATRAEFGLLKPVIKQLRANEGEGFQVDLVVTGTHLSESYGMTIGEIRNSGLRIDHQIEVLTNSATASNISANQADVLIKFTELFVKEQYDAVMLLGDRYETLAIAIAAGNTMTPIFHLCGGDTTEGACDEWIRHSITKMSYLHFVTNEGSRHRVIQLGEHPDRVFNYGSTSVDNIMAESDMSKLEALSSIGLKDCDYALCTYHPVTMDNKSDECAITELIDAMTFFPEIQFVITMANADRGGSIINEILTEASRNVDNLHLYSSLGVRRYLSLMKSSKFVLGNSSSGIIEAPSLRVPTVNIGDRQRGRLQPESVVNCTCDSSSIIHAIKRAMSEEHKAICERMNNSYGDGHAAEKIAKKSIEVLMNDSIDLRKSFYEINLE